MVPRPQGYEGEENAGKALLVFRVYPVWELGAYTLRGALL